MIKSLAGHSSTRGWWRPHRALCSILLKAELRTSGFQSHLGFMCDGAKPDKTFHTFPSIEVSLPVIYKFTSWNLTNSKRDHLSWTRY